MVPSSDDPAASVFPIHAVRSLCPACQAATWTSRLCLSHRQPTRQAASSPCHGRRLRAGQRIHLISLACTCGLGSHASTGREARAVIVGVHLRDSYAGNDTTVGGSKGRHIARNDRPWPEPTVGIGAATAAGTPGICRPSQGVACALAARQRALPASTPHHGFFRRIRGLRGVSGRLLSPHSRRMQSVLWESTVVQPRQAKPKAGRHPPSSGLKSLPQCIR